MSVARIISNFQNLISRVGNQTEVRCFEAFIQALVGIRGILYIDQYHQSYVRFPLSPLVSRFVRSNKCEICDVVIISYSAKYRHPAKLTFLQAKKEKKEIPILNRSSHEYTVDFRQHELLSARPILQPEGKLVDVIDPGILNQAFYESVGSFGFFVPLPSRQIDFCYFGASQLRPTRPIRSQFGKVEYLSTGTQGPYETDVALDLDQFLNALFDGEIGTPISGSPAFNDLLRSIDINGLDRKKRKILKKLLTQMNLNSENNKKLPFRFLVVSTDQLEKKNDFKIDPDLDNKKMDFDLIFEDQITQQIRLR